MKLTLRRSAKLRNRVADRIQEIQATHLQKLTASINVFDPDVSEQLTKHAENFNTAYARYTALSGVLVGIRQAINAANATYGVHDLLAEQAALLGRRRVLTNIAGLGSFRPTDEQIHARLDGQITMNKAGRGYGADTQISFVYLPELVVIEAGGELCITQARLDEIQDKLEAINSSRHIELSDQMVVTLTAEMLI
jgi:hypothetical protein